VKLVDFLVQALTGAPYPHVQYGKPTKATYDFAEKMLRAHMNELHGASVASDIQPRLLVGIFSLSSYPILNKSLNALRTQLYGRG
jgi:ribonucleotide monophosphatase NagD (HAD superfamily)